jgi:Carboxypeptidase regulatory-like domain
VTKTGTTIVFTTGPAIPAATLTGTVLAWADQRTLPQAVIRAAPLPDTVAYVTLADSAGNFRLPAVPPGRYRVWAIQDENNNRRQDRREAFDTVTVTVDSTASALLWAFVHDTVGPRVRTVEPIDSVDFRVAFSEPLDPRRALDTAMVRVLTLPDSTPVAVRALYTAARFDSIQTRARAVADSLKRLRDTTARKDTTARPGARPPAAQRAPAAPRGVGRAARPDTSAPKVDTARVRKLLSERPVPYDRVVVQTAQPLAPAAKYLVRVRGATNLSGVAADGQGVLVVPVPKPVTTDTTKTRTDTTKARPKPP